MIKVALILVLAPFISINGFTVQPKIVNGDLTDPSELPWFVHIKSREASCGATLISDRWALTAAHCLRYKRELVVRIGIKENYDAFAEMNISAADQYIHPEYANVSSTPHDIGLIKLPEIEPNTFVKPIRLPTQCSDHFDDVDVIAVGNGIKAISDWRYPDFKIRKGILKTLTTGECEERLTAQHFNVKPDGLLCAEPAKNGESIFIGDSGGPLLRQTNGDLIGVASFFYGNQLPELTIELQIWTKIQAYYEWISEVTGLELPNC